MNRSRHNEDNEDSEDNEDNEDSEDNEDNEEDDNEDKYNADNYTTAELLHFLNLPSDISATSAAEDVMFITTSNITKHNANAVSKQLISPKEAAQHLQLSLFFKEVQVKLLAEIAAASKSASASASASASTNTPPTPPAWDGAVSRANAAASASIRARSRAEAAEAAAAAVSATAPRAEPDVLAQQQQTELSADGLTRIPLMADVTEQLRWSRNQYLPPPPPPPQPQPGATGPAPVSSGSSGTYLHTDRANQFELARDENEHYVMKQRRLNIPSAFNVPIAQGTMNPTLRNTYKRTVIINSKRRAVIFPHSTDPLAPSSTTNFNVQLSEELKNVVSLQMLSVTIPYAWYAVDAATGTNCFHITVGDELAITITVPTGNYTPAGLIAAIQAQIAAADNLLSTKLKITYNASNGKCSFENTSGKGEGGSDIRLTFFDPARKLDCAAGCGQSNKINNSLGWILGFRSNSRHTTVEYNSFALDGMLYDIDNNVNTVLTSEAIVDTYGPKYFMIVLDDYKNNRINCGVVSVTSTDTRLDTPYYYDSDIPIECIPNPFGGPDKIKINIPSNPRTLTNGQLYTINEIRRNRELTSVDRVAEPTTSNVFALINFNKNGVAMGSPLVDSSPAIAAFKRDYFGPVTLQRFKVTLVDDNGFTVNLNGNDWSFTFSAESLYEY
jgi:hypothetical protein